MCLSLNFQLVITILIQMALSYMEFNIDNDRFFICKSSNNFRISDSDRHIVYEKFASS